MSSSIAPFEESRLLELCCPNNCFDRNEEDIEEIVKAIHDRAPKLFENLSRSNIERIAKTCYVKAYQNNDPVFYQGDLPDSYYTVIRGTVSIYAASGTDSINKKDQHDKMDRSQYGKFLVQLPPGASFGELSFNANFVHTKRNGSVISDGSHGNDHDWTQDDDENHCRTDRRHQRMKDDSNATILLLIPEKTYMSELYGFHAAKHQTKEKISFLKSSFLFSHWPYDELVKMAYAMKKISYDKGETIAHQGERVEGVTMIISGDMKIIHKMHKGNEKGIEINESKDGNSSSIILEIAELGQGDMFGLVEVLGNLKKMRREAIAHQGPVKAYKIAASSFQSFFRHQQKTIKMLQKVVFKRNRWEKLRKEYASRFVNTMPLTLPPNAMKLSHYKISLYSVLSERESKIRSKKEKEYARALREIRLQCRVFSNLTVGDVCHTSNPSCILKLLCKEATELADDLQDDTKKKQVAELRESLTATGFL